MDLHNFLDTILTIPNLFIMIASSCLIQAICKAFPKQVKSSWFIRMQPLLPLILCSIFVWLPGARPVEEFGPRLFVGIILGMTSSSIYKIYKQSVMGKDERIKKKDVIGA